MSTPELTCHVSLSSLLSPLRLYTRVVRFVLRLPSCINLVVNLRSYHNMSTAQAYAIATAQFAHLRAIQEHATRSAAHEARAYGGRLTGGEIVRRPLAHKG